VNRTEVRTGPSGPVFFAAFFGLLLSACTPLASQAPDVELVRVHESGAQRIAFDPGSRRIASGGYRGGIKVWSTRDGDELYASDAHSRRITGLGWLDERRLISIDSSGLLLISDIDERTQLNSTRFSAVVDMVISPDRTWFLIITGDDIRKISLPALDPITQYRIESPLSVAISHSGERVAVSSAAGNVILLDADLQPLVELAQPSRKARDLVFSPDDRLLLAGGWFRLLVWQLDGNSLQEHATEHLGKVNSVDISPDGSRWVSLGRDTDSQFLLYDAATLGVERRLKTHALCGRRARFSPNGRYVASAADDGSVHIYDLSTPYQPAVPYLEEY
jgi:WD40 repeat protein